MFNTYTMTGLVFFKKNIIICKGNFHKDFFSCFSRNRALKHRERKTNHFHLETSTLQCWLITLTSSSPPKIVLRKVNIMQYL